MLDTGVILKFRFNLTIHNGHHEFYETSSYQMDRILLDYEVYWIMKYNRLIMKYFRS